MAVYRGPMTSFIWPKPPKRGPTRWQQRLAGGKLLIPLKRDGKAPRCWLFSLKHKGKEEDFLVETLPVVNSLWGLFFSLRKGVWSQSNWLQTLQDCFQQNCWGATQPKLLESSYWPWKIVWKGMLLECKIYICIYSYESMIHINILCDNPKMIWIWWY